MQGVGSVADLTVSATVLVQMSRVGQRGRIIALYQAGLHFGIGVGSGIGGFLVAWFGYAAPFWAFGIIALIARVVSAVFLIAPDAYATSVGVSLFLIPVIRQTLAKRAATAAARSAG